MASSTCRPTFFTPSPPTYVRHALNTLGVASTTCGYWPHSIQVVAPFHTGTGPIPYRYWPHSTQVLAPFHTGTGPIPYRYWPHSIQVLAPFHTGIICWNENSPPLHFNIAETSEKLKYQYLLTKGCTECVHNSLPATFAHHECDRRLLHCPPPPPPPTHTHTQSWLASCLPQWLWVWVISLLFRRHRLQSITSAKKQGSDNVLLSLILLPTP